MKKLVQTALVALGLSVAMACQAAETPEPGQRMSPEQLAQWGQLRSYTAGSSRLRVLPVPPADGEGVLLLSSQDVVGLSRNEVLVVGASEDQVRAAASAPAPVSVQYMAPTGSALLRYAEFGQAVAALKALKTNLPGATVRLPVQWGKTPVPR